MSFAVVCHIWTTVSCQKCFSVICCCSPHMDNSFMSKKTCMSFAVVCHMDNCFMSNILFTMCCCHVEHGCFNTNQNILSSKPLYHSLCHNMIWPEFLLVHGFVRVCIAWDTEIIFDMCGSIIYHWNQFRYINVIQVSNENHNVVSNLSLMILVILRNLHYMDLGLPWKNLNIIARLWIYENTDILCTCFNTLQAI